MVAILQSFLRPQNMQKICMSILGSKNVDCLILSNNNPAINILDYIAISDSRLQIINQKAQHGSIKRFELADASNSQFFFSIDDDVFLSTEQIEYLMRKLIKYPSQLHGIWGMTYHKKGNEFTYEYGITGKNVTVDILNRVYFFSSKHVKQFFELIKLLHLTIEDLRVSDDIILSLSQIERPVIHDIGLFKDCPTSNDPIIAVWLQENFFKYREELLLKIIDLKSR